MVEEGDVAAASRDGNKPFNASFGASARYTASGEAVQVLVEGTVCDGELLGRNGPRVQVRFVLDGATYVRWFDADALLDSDETPV
jgi:hypothetical protein